jgi:hypothetical protein
MAAGRLAGAIEDRDSSAGQIELDDFEINVQIVARHCTATTDLPSGSSAGMLKLAPTDQPSALEAGA